MIKLTNNEEEAQYFITDIIQENGQLLIKYANGTEESTKFNEHNLNIFHNKMIAQAKKYLPAFKNEISLQLSKIYNKRFISIILEIILIYFFYNTDIHLIMKIILTIAIVLGELIYLLYSEIELQAIDPYIREIYATESYLKNIDTFKEFDSENYTNRYILPIEDIAHYKLDQNFIESAVETIKNLKETGAQEITLTYKKKTDS